MADSQPPTTEKAAVNSVVNDLMRVYENLTQSSTPQAGTSDASKTLTIAYNTAGAPHTVTVPVFQPPPGYSIPPNVYQQQQHEAGAKHALHVKSDPTAPAQAYYQQPSVGYAQVPMATVTTVTSSDAQRSGEESHTLMRTSSIASKISQATHGHHQPPADASSESDKSNVARSRRKRKPPKEVSVSAGGGGSKKGGRNKKSKKEDGRWSKRFTWPEDLHRDFVSAIFDVGLKHSSPSTIMEHMPKHEQITTERIKSHLQKYRLHRVKSKKEFISSYEASLRNFQQNQNGSSTNLVSGSGEVAAHLTASTLGAGKPNAAAAKENPAATTSNGDDNQKLIQLHGSQNGNDGNDSLILPQLTEAEKASPIGAAMGYLMGLFFSLKQQLIIQRSLEAAGEKAKGNVIFASSTPSMVAPDAANAVTSAATAAAVAAGVEYVAADSNMQASQPQNGAARNNIEVNSMMKREMQNQMALQNKMRALKQQELDKYKGLAEGNPHLSNSVPMEAVAYTSGVGTSEKPQQAVPQQVATQGAGEMAGNDMNRGDGNNNQQNSNLLGIENSEEFWQNDVMDDQLFEFLMNS